VDDDIHAILVRAIPPGARMHAIMDCCHSGTGMDLPFMFDGTRITGGTWFLILYLSSCSLCSSRRRRRSSPELFSWRRRRQIRRQEGQEARSWSRWWLRAFSTSRQWR
jgi:hypothetical protein